MCEICGRTTGKHHTSCPYYITPKSKYYCDYCNEPILDGEEYIKNDYGKYRHWDCFYDKEDLAVWLGYKKELMEGDDG